MYQILLGMIMSLLKDDDQLVMELKNIADILKVVLNLLFNTPYQTASLYSVRIYRLSTAPISTIEVKRAIINSKSSKSAGLNEIAFFIIMGYSHIFIQLVIYILNTDETSETFPSQLNRQLLFQHPTLPDS
jgi:hypothetical protein